MRAGPLMAVPAVRASRTALVAPAGAVAARLIARSALGPLRPASPSARTVAGPSARLGVAASARATAGLGVARSSLADPFADAGIAAPGAVAAAAAFPGPALATRAPALDLAFRTEALVLARAIVRPRAFDADLPHAPAAAARAVARRRTVFAVARLRRGAGRPHAVRAALHSVSALARAEAHRERTDTVVPVVTVGDRRDAVPVRVRLRRYAHVAPAHRVSGARRDASLQHAAISPARDEAVAAHGAAREQEHPRRGQPRRARPRRGGLRGARDTAAEVSTGSARAAGVTRPHRAAHVTDIVAQALGGCQQTSPPRRGLRRPGQRCA